MRYDKPIYFQKVTQGAYNANTGDYEADTVEETLMYASIYSCDIETLRLIYGEIKQGVLKVQLQNHYNEHFNRIRIGDTLYKVDSQKKLRVKHIFIVSEIQ